MFVSRRVMLVTGVLLILIIFAGVAYAQETDPIQACFAKDGTLRIVGSTEECKRKESPLIWNVEGPQGEQGIQGPPGVIFYRKVGDAVLVDPGVPVPIRVDCDPGDSATGGGYSMAGGIGDLQVYFMYPEFSHYELGANNSGPFAISVRAHVICADVAP